MNIRYTPEAGAAALLIKHKKRMPKGAHHAFDV
jgi:hypothetical protein